MASSKKNILIWTAVAVALGILVYAVKKAASAKLPATSGGTTVNTQQMTGILDDNNWDDAGGYRYVFPDKSVEYYHADRSLAGVGDPAGNFTAAQDMNLIR